MSSNPKIDGKSIRPARSAETMLSGDLGDGGPGLLELLARIGERKAATRGDDLVME